MSRPRSDHPAARALSRDELRREIRSWAASEGRRVGPAAADRLIERLIRLYDLDAAEKSVGPRSVVVTMAGYRRRGSDR